MWSFQTISHPDLTRLAHIFVLDSRGQLSRKYRKPHLIEHHGTPLFSIF